MLLDTLDCLAQAPDTEAFFQVIEQAFETREVSGYGYGLVPMVLELKHRSYTKATLFRHTYPPGWVNLLGAGHMLDLDPAIDQFVANDASCVFWDDATLLQFCTPAQRRHFERENDIGMRYGLSLALRGGATSNSVSGIGLWFAGARSARGARCTWDEHGAELRVLAAALDDNMRGVRKDGLVKLKPREREALTWLASGLSVQRIADKMGVTDKKAYNLLHAARDSIGAENLPHAATRGVVLGLLSL